MKRICFVPVFALLSIVIGAQDYQLDFAISGDDETLIDSVVVLNIDQDHRITLQGDDILHLMATPTGISDLRSLNREMQIYPNPSPGKATIIFQNQKQGQVQLSLLDMGGKIVAQKSQFQAAGKCSVELNGLSMGAYVIQVVTETSVFSKVVLSDDASGANPEIIFSGSGEGIAAEAYVPKSVAKTGTLVEMQYDEGDTLSLCAYFDGFSSKQQIVPVASSSVSFDFPINKDIISATAEITIEGGALQVIDESGNIIKLNFPPGAVMDTTTVSLTLLGEHKDLPIYERKMRTFEISPADLSLNRPVEVSIEYNTEISEIEHIALFQVRSEDFLLPLGDHVYSDDNKILNASTLILGEFTEGNMSLEQINELFDLLSSLMGISWETAAKSSAEESQTFSNGGLHKEIWNEQETKAKGSLTLIDQKFVKKPGDEPPGNDPSPEEMIEKLCKTVIHDAVQEILDLGLPDNPCDRDYITTIYRMKERMMALNCTGDDLNRVNEAYEQILVNCHTHVSIYTELDIESGGLMVYSDGVVQIFNTSSAMHTAIVEGSGSLRVYGGTDIVGDCIGTVSGSTQVEVSGSRDGAFTYYLTIDTDQDALLTTVCKHGTNETALAGEGSRVVKLSKANEYTVNTTEQVGDGIFKVQVQLINPYTTIFENH